MDSEGFLSISPTSEELEKLDELLRDHRPSRRPRPVAKPEPSPYLSALARAFLLAPEDTDAARVLDRVLVGQQTKEGFDDSWLEGVSAQLHAEGLLS